MTVRKLVEDELKKREEEIKKLVIPKLTSEFLEQAVSDVVTGFRQATY